MKKSLLVLATAACVANFAHAESGALYIRGEGGAAMFSQIKIGVLKNELKFKSKITTQIGVGFGYNVSNEFRAEVVYSHLFGLQHKKTLKNDEVDVSVKAKTNIDVIMLKGAFDVFDFNYGKFFVGGGIGVSRIGGKVSETGTMTRNGTTVGLNNNAKLKNKTNVSFAAEAGACFELADGVFGDVKYSFTHYGKNEIKKNFSSHGVIFGVRFNI